MLYWVLCDTKDKLVEKCRSTAAVSLICDSCFWWNSNIPYDRNNNQKKKKHRKYRLPIRQEWLCRSYRESILSHSLERTFPLWNTPIFWLGHLIRQGALSQELFKPYLDFYLWVMLQNTSYIGWEIVQDGFSSISQFHVLKHGVLFFRQ